MSSAVSGPRDPERLSAPSAERGRETRERLLDAAEALFSQRGFEGTGIRHITQVAGVSVSAAHYHFGSKQALLHATLARRIAPISRDQLALLEAAQAVDPEPPVEALLRAFLTPLFEHRAERSEETRLISARLHAERPERVAALKRELFTPISERFLAALAVALPHQTARQHWLGFQLVVGAMVHVMSGNLETAPGIQVFGTGEPPRVDDAELLPSLITFLAAGLRASGKEPQ